MPQGPLIESSGSGVYGKSVRQLARGVLTQSDLKAVIGAEQTTTVLTTACGQEGAFAGTKNPARDRALTVLVGKRLCFAPLPAKASEAKTQ
jgi:hypothetical protein